jgi:hypothetical protein
MNANASELRFEFSNVEGDRRISFLLYVYLYCTLYRSTTVVYYSTLYVLGVLVHVLESVICAGVREPWSAGVLEFRSTVLYYSEYKIIGYYCRIVLSTW